MSSPAKNVLLGGGTGFIGSHLKRAFEKNGFSVTVVSRKPGSGKIITWDELQKNGLPSNIEFVVNTAGENVLNPIKRWTDEFKNQVISSRVRTNEILKTVIDEAERKPSALLSLSGVSIYKPNTDTIYDEESDVQPFDFLSELVRSWERPIHDTDRTVRKIIIRSGVVLGRNGGMIKQIFLPFYLGLGGPMGSGAQYFPWIHIQDLVRVALYSLQNTRVVGVVNGVAPEIITNKQFAEAFAKSLKRPAFFPVPSQVVGVIFGNERASMILDGQKVRSKKLQEDPGFNFNFPTINEAVRDIVKH